MSGQKVIPVRIGEVILYDERLVLVKLIQNHEIQIQDVKEHVAAAIKLSNDSDFVVVLDGGVTLDVTDEAMTYIARLENKKWLAFAIVVRSISERLFANYYLKFKKPIRPTQAFTTPKGAETWLRQFIKIDKPLNYII